MPSNLLKLSSSSTESEYHNRSDFERSGSLDSQDSHHSRSRSNMDDENLKYLTNEEKNALLFLEETLDAFEDDIEEPPVSLNSSFGYYSPRSMYDHSDSDDIIDLVQTGHSHEEIISDTGSGPTTNGLKHTQQDSKLLNAISSANVPVAIPASNIHREEEHFPSDLPVDYPKLLGAVPTPVIIAQKISEKKAENTHVSPISPKEEKSELKKSVATSPIDGGHFVFPGSPDGKLNRFPNNISVKLAGKQYNKTIAKAAVNVQERKAQVLANLHGPSLFAEEIDGKTGEIIRRTSFRDVVSEQTRYEALTKLGLVKEMPIQANIQANSSCTSPVSNGQHSPKFFPPEIQRRLSNEKVNINTQHSPKILSPESKFLITETKRIPSKDQDNISSLYLPKVLTEESNRRLSNGQINTNVQYSPKILSSETNKKVSNEHHFSNGQITSKLFTTETKRIPSKEQDNMSGQHLPKVAVEESSRRLSNEQESISKILSSEPSAFVPLGKTVVIKGESTATSLDASKRHSSIYVTNEQKQPSTQQEIKRTYSVPRPTGFRPQGITVQFSGRDSSEETRKDALRKLGLLKGQSGH